MSKPDYPTTMSQPAFSDRGLHVIVKPIGPVCNIACEYCFYLGNEALYPQGEQWRMSDDTLEAYVRQYIEVQPRSIDQIDFTFQGGEPTLMGLDFFRRVVRLQKNHTSYGLRIQNSLQTNGIRLNDEWCAFLREHNFLVGLSIDGPEDLHNRYRVNRNGQGTFDQVVRAMERLRNHGVQFNVLCCVNRFNGDHPLRVYRFFRRSDVNFIQFIPVVERCEGVRLYEDPGDAPPEALVTERSVKPKQFGRFLTAVFDEWIRRDVGRVFVRDFDQALAAWMNVGASLCVYSKECGRAMAIEHNGDLYSCDHFVDLDHKLGNIHDSPLVALANAPPQEDFGRSKSQSLPRYCRQCEFRFACHGSCPKDRFLKAPDGEPGLNYLCAGYKLFLAHIDPQIKAMAEELRAGRPAAGVMRRVRAIEQCAQHQRRP